MTARRAILGLELAALLLVCDCKRAQPEPAAELRTVRCSEPFRDVVPISQCDASCKAGDAEACEIASSRIANGTYVRRDRPRAVALALRGCELGSLRACRGAAAIGSDAGVPDLTALMVRALTLTEAECAEGRAPACQSASYAHTGDKRQKLARRALELYERACDRGDWFACNELAFAKDTGGLGLTADPAEALKLYLKACKLGDATACAGAFEPSAPDEVSVPLLERGCELGDPYACYLLGERLTGEAALNALQKACDRQDASGCRLLAEQARIAGDVARERRAFLAACELDETCPKSSPR